MSRKEVIKDMTNNTKPKDDANQIHPKNNRNQTNKNMNDHQKSGFKKPKKTNNAIAIKLPFFRI